MPFDQHPKLRERYSHVSECDAACRNLHWHKPLPHAKEPADAARYWNGLSSVTPSICGYIVESSEND